MNTDFNNDYPFIILREARCAVRVARQAADNNKINIRIEQNF